MTDFKLPELGENVAAGDVLARPGEGRRHDRQGPGRSSSSRPTRRPSKCRRRSPASSPKSRSRRATRSRSARSSSASRTTARQRRRRRAPEPKPTADGRRAGGGRRRRAGRRDAPAPPGDRGEGDDPTDREPRSRPSEAGARPTRPTSREPRRRGAGGGDKVRRHQPRRRGAARRAPRRRARPAAPAAPSVRRLARELGVDIDQVPGTGPSGRISQDDVKAHAKRADQPGRRRRRPAAAALSRGGRCPTSRSGARSSASRCARLRRKTAEHLTARVDDDSARHAVRHGRHHRARGAAQEVREAGRERPAATSRSPRCAVKVVAAALKVFPQFNASIDLGSAARSSTRSTSTSASRSIPTAACSCRSSATPTRRTSCRSAVELAAAGREGARREAVARRDAGRLLQHLEPRRHRRHLFTPIVNSPEVAILGISRGAHRAGLARHGAFVPRLMLPLSLSYDHRVIDGADAIRFLRWVVEALEQPFLLALQRLSIGSRHRRLNSSSSAPGPAATPPRSTPPTSACRSRSSTRRRTPAASASIAAASRRRRCCTSPR